MNHEREAEAELTQAAGGCHHGVAQVHFLTGIPRE